MRHNRIWMPAILFARHGLSQARVVVGDVLHFQSRQAGPFQPLLQMGFGTPPQLITGILDTGSGDIIIPQAGSAVCKLRNQQCRDAPVVLGDFDSARASDVAQVPGSSFNATFSGGDGFDGPYIKTTVNLGAAARIGGAQVALAVNGSLPGEFPQFPIFGVGPQEAEQTQTKYVNLLARMKETGAIAGNVMGIVLNRTPFQNGSVVFGGVDRAKFKGALQEVAIERADNGKILDFVVAMSSVRLQMNGKRPGQVRQQRQQQQQGGRQSRRSYAWQVPRRLGSTGRHGRIRQVDAGQGSRNRTNLTNGPSCFVDSGRNKTNGRTNKGGNGTSGTVRNGTNSNNKSDVCSGCRSSTRVIDLGLRQEERFTLVDTGGVGLLLPDGSMRNLASALGTTFTNGGLGLVDCALASDDENKLLFGFNQDRTTVGVPLSHALVSRDLLTPEDQRSGKCALAISSVAPGSNLNSMGFPWGSAVYTVYDLDKNRLLFGEAVQNATGSDVQEFR